MPVSTPFVRLGRQLVVGFSLGILTACAIGPGAGFATIEPGTLSAGLDLSSGRQDAQGRWKTSNGYLLQLTDPVRLSLEKLALQAPGRTGTAASGGTFDPANPPPRYSNCHSGHCHRDDGALVDYEDIQAEMSGGGAAAPQTVLTLPLSQAEVSFVPGTDGSVALTGCSPDCFLEQGALDRLSLTVSRLQLSGTVQADAGGASLGDAPRAWRLDLPLQALTLTSPVGLTISRSGPAGFRVTGTFQLSEKLLDGIEWARLASTPGVIDLVADARTQETLLVNLAQSRWTAAFEPRP